MQYVACVNVVVKADDIHNVHVGLSIASFKLGMHDIVFYV